MPIGEVDLNEKVIVVAEIGNNHEGDFEVAKALVRSEESVKQRAKEIYQQWTKELGGMDHEVIDASVSNSSGRRP